MTDVGGYCVSITLHRDYSYAVIQEMPSGEQRTVPSAKLPYLLADMALNPTREMLRSYFESAPPSAARNDGWVTRRGLAKKEAAE